MLSRRGFVTLLLGASAAALARDTRLLLASAGPPEGELRAAQAATAGPVRVPDRIRLRLSTDSYCTMPFEEYLKGVVPSEMPASWPSEALRAQAVAARTYAATYFYTYGYIWTDTRSQVWNPNNRDARSDAAVDSTSGQVLAYRGELPWTYYSSTCGGQTTTSPDLAAAYCQAVRCWLEPDGSGRVALDLSSEDAARSFWGGRPRAFCETAGTPYRSSWSTARGDMERSLDQSLPSLTTVSPRYSAGQLGELRDLAVLFRGRSGQATAIRIVGSGGQWDVSGDFAIRTALGTRSSKVVLVIERDGTTLSRVTGTGGGFGHGIGLCQWGVRGMAAGLSGRAYTYDQILRHYYSDVVIQAVSPSRTSEQTLERRIYLPMIGQATGSCS